MTSPKAKYFLFMLVKGVSLNYSYNAWNTTTLHSSLGLVPSSLDPKALEKQGPLAAASILRFLPLEITFPFESLQASPWLDIFKQTTSKKPAKQKNLLPVCNGLPTKNPTIQLGKNEV